MEYPKILLWFITVYSQKLIDSTMKYIMATLFHIPRRLA
jgi:hypothetical protein